MAEAVHAAVGAAMHAVKGEAAAELRQSLHAHLGAELRGTQLSGAAPALAAEVAADVHGVRAQLEEKLEGTAAAVAQLQGAQQEAQQAQQALMASQADALRQQISAVHEAVPHHDRSELLP